MIARFSWFPRVALGGLRHSPSWPGRSRPYFPLAYFAKGVEIALIGLITIDVFRVYGSPMGLIRSAMTSVFGDRTEA